MSKLDKALRDLPPDETTFVIDVIGEVTKRRFLGEFTCKIPTIKDQCMMDKHRSYLNGEFSDNLEPGTLKFNKMVAYLRYTLKDVPSFWKKVDMGYELRDPNVIEEVYNQVLAFEDKWLKQVWDDVPEETEEDGNEEKQNPQAEG